MKKIVNFFGNLFSEKFLDVERKNSTSPVQYFGSKKIKGDHARTEFTNFRRTKSIY